MKKYMALVLICALVFGCVPFPAQAETTFTLMIYLCGSDLETDDGSASMDILEMAEVDLSADGPFTVLVETGGAYEWWLEGIDPANNERWIVADNDLYRLDSRPRADMGDDGTLADFILYCMDTAPADRYGLILWDHGGGSTAGVCYDEFTDDYLTAGEVRQALETARRADSGFHLDFIGLDACLMATFELANYVRDHADYMIASEELMPVYGFDYKALLSTLDQDPGIDTARLMRSTADAYYETNLAHGPDDYLTISVIDLSRMEALTAAMERMSDGLALALDAGRLSTISRDRQNMRSLGDFGSGTSDMVDLGHFIRVYADVSGADAAAALGALEEAVVYNRYTQKHLDNISGLSILVPLDTRDEFPYYSRAYDPLDLFPGYSAFISGYTALLSGGSYVFTASTPEAVSGYGMLSSLGENISFSGAGENFSTSITQIDQAHASGDADDEAVGEGGVYTYSLTLSKEDMEHLSYVEGNLMIDISDDTMEAYVDLGYLQNTVIDWDSNTVYSLFDGTWPVLEGQVVHMTDQIITATSRRSLINAWVNDLDVYLLVVFDEERPDGEVIGYTQGYNENGLPARGHEKLEPGDIITPQYYLYYYEDGEEYIEAFDGDPIVYTGSPLAFGYEDISGQDTNFAYTFCLNDIFGDYTFTDFIFFTL